jgi:adenosylcobinamide kinase/adenosylcobinamide-phosphate guanylyltransferase
MARLTLITGGCRSGKSREAMKRALSLGGPRWFVATARPGDPEFDQRIDRHRTERAHLGFAGTREAPVDLEHAVATLPKPETTVIDCMTLWMSNLLLAHPGFDEHQAEQRARALVGVCCGLPGNVLVVTNEVGSGVVPEWEIGRAFRDCLGRTNQILAEQADTAILVVCGLPIVLKQSGSNEE